MILAANDRRRVPRSQGEAGLAFIALVLLTLGASPRSTAKPDLPRGYWGEAETRPIPPNARAPLAPDLSGLPPASGSPSTG